METELRFDSGFAPEDFERRTEDLLRRGNAELEAVMQTLALATESDARRRAPVDTGNLRASLDSDVDSRRGRILAHVGTNVEYAAFVEFGTVNTGAQPFLRPAVDLVGGRMEAQIAQTMFRVIGRVSE